jgi:aarF domain-containing kinase
MLTNIPSLYSIRVHPSRDKQNTGDESQVMVKAHTNAGFALGEPFSLKYSDDLGVYDWSKQNATKTVGEEAKVFLEHRLVPPPKEIYSLHRRLSGAYTISIKLGARVKCRKQFMKLYNNYKFD